MLQWLYTYVTNVSSQCFSVFLDVCCKCVYLDIAYVSHICSKYFIWMLHTCCNDFQAFDVFFHVFEDEFFKCFICLKMYIVNVLSGYFKSRSCFAHVAIASVACG
jgi:hypothetical protein